MEIFNQGFAHAAIVERGGGMVERKKVIGFDIFELLDNKLAVNFRNFQLWEKIIHRMPTQKDN